MPNHLHLLTSGTTKGSNLLAYCKDLKQQSAYRFKQATGLRLWQKKYYDHILRPEDQWEAVAYYIWMNPVRQELCRDPADWPFSGSFTVDWKKLMEKPPEPWVPPWKK